MNALALACRAPNALNVWRETRGACPFLARFCDDGRRWPGHPGWRPSSDFAAYAAPCDREVWLGQQGATFGFWTRVSCSSPSFDGESLPMLRKLRNWT